MILQSNIERIVAIKCIERSRLTKVSTENLFTEIKVMKELDHKHIVKLEDFEVSHQELLLLILVSHVCLLSVG